MADEKDLIGLVPGSKVVISGCEARHHGDPEGCLCDIKGTVQTMGKRYETPFVGTPTWHLVGRAQRVRLSEITFLQTTEES